MEDSVSPFGTLLVRVSPDDIVVYANNALAQYVHAPKSELVGTPLEVLAGRCTGEVAECFRRPESGRASNHLVTDDSGRVFEVRIYSEAGVLDIVLDEVTDANAIAKDLLGTTGTALESLSEDELRTSRQPERRYLTVSTSRLHDLSLLAGKIPPGEARLIVDCFFEEVSDAIMETGCTVAGTTGDLVTGVFGAPRHFADHPLRAVRAACETLHKAADLHANFHRQGKEIPPFSCGLWTGEVLVGGLGVGAFRKYSAIGVPVDLARQLARLARPGEILLPEHTLTHILRVLPPGWSHFRGESEAPPDLSDFQWAGESVLPIPGHLQRIVFLVGPGADEDPSRAEYYFDYLWCLKVPGHDNPVPILRVVRPSAVGDSLEFLDENTIASAPSETLGKYRLVEILGTGGMGRVWRGIDRFGNNVAIKVLHSSESIGEAQLKRFRREAEVMARLPHRNICRVYEMNEFEGIQYIAMEYVDGLSLADLLYGSRDPSSQPTNDLPSLIRSLRAQKSILSASADPEESPAPRSKTTLILPVQQSLSIVLKICEATQFAHEHGVLHRDLKPGNILLREDGEPLVADFGLAKLRESEDSQSLSMSGHVVGTLENMPPEQAESSKDVDERADVYAIGTILFQMLTGHRHFEATGNIVSDAAALKAHEPPRLRPLNPRIDSDLEIITLKALRNNPDQRYRSVSALRADLERYLNGEVISAKPASAIDLMRKLIQRNKAVTLTAAASLALIVAIVATAVFSLARQLDREQAALRESESLRALAEENQALAQTRQAEAEEKERIATRALESEKQALAAKRSALAAQQAAEQAAEVARERSKEAVAESETERQKREEAEKRAQEASQMLESRDNEIANIHAAREQRREQWKPFPKPENINAARRAVGEASMMLHFELTPFELERWEKNPEHVLSALSRALDLVSSGLCADPDFTPGWVLKGRLHLAAMEFPAAAAAFDAAQQAQVKRPEREDSDDIEALKAFAESATPAFGSRASELAQPLFDLPGASNHAAANILQFFAKKPAVQTSFTSSDSPLGRGITKGEIMLGILKANGSPAEVSGGPSPQPLTVSIDGSAADLSILKGSATTTLALKHADAIDWETLQTLPLESLDLSGSNQEAIPPHQRAYLRIKSLNLSDTSIRDLSFARSMPALETLNLSGTGPCDLSPLVICRRLRTLDMSGADHTGLQALLNLPLDSLTLSPQLLSDKSGLSALRRHRTLRSLRTPEDPDPQAPMLFWKHLDSQKTPANP